MNRKLLGVCRIYCRCSNSSFLIVLSFPCQNVQAHERPERPCLFVSKLCGKSYQTIPTSEGQMASAVASLSRWCSAIWQSFSSRGCASSLSAGCATVSVCDLSGPEPGNSLAQIPSKTMSSQGLSRKFCALDKQRALRSTAEAHCLPVGLACQDTVKSVEFSRSMYGLH